MQSARAALAAALAEMISEGELSEPQALQLAHGYLHDNAVAIYEGQGTLKWRKQNAQPIKKYDEGRET